MKFIKGLIKFILGLLIIVILLGDGTYVFVRVKYGIDPINTINQLSQLNEKVDEKKLAPDPFDENDLTGAMTSLNNSVPNLVSYDEQNGYSFNYSIDKRFVATYQITDKELGALADTLLKTQAKDGIKIGDTLVPISLIDFSFSPNIISGETITTFSVLVKISLDPFIAKMNSFPLNMLRNKVPENLYVNSIFDVTKTDDSFGYNVNHNTLKLNYLTSADSEDFINTLNALLSIGTAESLNMTIGSKIMDLLIGTQFDPGLIYNLSYLGATTYEFSYTNNQNLLTVK